MMNTQCVLNYLHSIKIYTLDTTHINDMQHDVQPVYVINSKFMVRV